MSKIQMLAAVAVVAWLPLAADFNALVEDLVGALDKFKVGAAEKNQLLGVLGPMQSQIVEKR